MRVSSGALPADGQGGDALRMTGRDEPVKVQVTIGSQRTTAGQDVPTPRVDVGPALGGVRRSRPRSRGTALPTDPGAPVRRSPALLVPALVLALSGCLVQDQEANDNPPPVMPSPPAGVVRTPEAVESAPAVVEAPGPTRGPSESP